MKTILLSICLIFCCQYSFAQLNTYPAKIDTSCSPSLFDMELDGLITGGPALVHWVRTIVFMTKGWTNYICTDQNCFPNDVSTGDFSLKAGNSALLFVHFNPNNIEGCATVNFTISDNNDPNNTFTSVYNMCTWATATGDLKSKQSIQVFPNPTSDFFSINNKQNISSIKVSNILGKTLKTYSTNLDSYDVSDLVAGIYILQMIDGKGRTVKTSRLSVRKP